MKQGTAGYTITDRKVEPRSHAVPPAYPAELGIIESRVRSIPMYTGRGIEAPMESCTTHKHGSQGKY
jgi:hypothetical protein